MQQLSVVQLLVAWSLPVIFAITVHEVAHGWVAKRLGDPTADLLGRLTLNPIKHIDLIGTLLVPGLLIVMGGIVFGWAKPVPVNYDNLRNPRRDMAIVAAAGPLANLAMAVLWGILMKIGFTLGEGSAWARPLVSMGVAGITINVILMIVNLLPVPPLDGGRVAMGVLPGNAAATLGRLEPYGIIILLGLLITGVLGKLLMGPVSLVESTLYALLGL